MGSTPNCRRATGSATALMIVLLIAMPTSTAFSQTATRADYEEWCQMYEGRMMGQLPLPVEFPGIGQKGEKLAVNAELRRVADGHGLLATAWIGDGIITSLTVYDAAAKQVRYLEVHSGGAIWDVVCFKKKGKWKTRGVGTNPDGSKATSEFEIRLIKDEDAIEIAGAIKGPGGEVNQVQVIYRRVGKPE